MKHMRIWNVVWVLLTSILASDAAPAPIVDLEYASYQGYYDSEFGLNVFKG